MRSIGRMAGGSTKRTSTRKNAISGAIVVNHFSMPELSAVLPLMLHTSIAEHPQSRHYGVLGLPAAPADSSPGGVSHSYDRPVACVSNQSSSTFILKSSCLSSCHT